MNVENWNKIKEIFNEAVELAEVEREKFLSEACESPEIRAEVEKLLAADEKAETMPNILLSFDSTSRQIGQKIGNYKILREIGKGGMGAVFLATREDFSKQVALKIIKRGLDSKDLVRRFENERQILATLEHPNIARLFDGGTTDEDLPYFVMEFVEGEELLDYCNSRNLSVSERLKIFRKVCAAVSYAHGKLIVHRDLKPSNIIVTNDGEPKLLDFGISKIINEDSFDEKGTATALGMMTPNYASPEQFRGESVSTSTDVYSLGVILFELLTGNLPYNLQNKRADELAKIICETAPAKPSDIFRDTQTRRHADTAKQPNSTKQFTASPRLRVSASQLKGDLDNIILKALRKEAARRYLSVEQFAEDLRRHLEGLPVSARPDTFLYRAEKFINRNRVSMVAGLLILLSLIGCIGGISWQYFRAERQRILAEKRFEQVRELANNVVFKYHDEIKDLQGATRVRELLVQDALKYLDNLQAESSNDVVLTRELAQAYIRIANVQGGSYQANLGDSKGASESYQKAVNLLEPLVENSTDIKLLAELRDAYTESGRTFFRVGEVEKQSANLEKAVKLSEKMVELVPNETESKIFLARTLVHWADTFGSDIERKDDNAKKIEIYRKSLEITENCLAPEPENITALRMLATVTHRLQLHISFLAENAKNAKDFEREKSLWQEALVYAKNSTSALEKVLLTNPESPAFQRNAAGSKLNQGKIYRQLGDTEAALRLPNEALKVQFAIAASDPRNNEIKLDLKESYEDLALAHIKRGEIEKAFENFNKSVAYNEEMLKTDAENFEFWIAKLRGQQVFADALLEKGETATAKNIYEKAIVKAETETPKKFTDFVEKFKKEVNESLRKCV